MSFHLENINIMHSLLDLELKQNIVIMCSKDLHRINCISLQVALEFQLHTLVFLFSIQHEALRFLHCHILLDSVTNQIVIPETNAFLFKPVIWFLKTDSWFDDKPKLFIIFSRF